MFKKLLSNLPFNPSLITQVSFYARRLKRETAVRRLGLVFVVLGMLVQIVAIVSPPQPTLARSGNDLVDGGIGSQAGAINACNSNLANYGDILGYYNISCSDLSNTSVVNLNSRDYNSQLYSMGRIAYGKAGETPVSIKGTSYYLRYLWSWDGASSSTYTALRGTTQDGHTYFILFDCGNLVFVGLPNPTPRCQWNPFLYLSTDPRCVAPPVPKSTPTPKPTPAPKCIYNANILASDSACKPCEESQTKEDKTACLEFSKSARNNTQNISDANGTTAHAGDTITYTLSVKNKGKADIDSYKIQENISDVLDYADIVNLNGASKNSSDDISWPAVKIKASQTVSKQFIVKVKNPIPSTPISSSDPGHFDLMMTNVYGNTVDIKLPSPPMKTAETLARAQELPNTGPGEMLFVGFGMITVVGYFFARSRLMAKELAIIKADYSSGGV